MANESVPRVKIVSDGTRLGTRVTLNGEPLRGVRAINWSLNVGDRMGARVEIELAEVDVVLEGMRSADGE